MRALGPCLYLRNTMGKIANKRTAKRTTTLKKTLRKRSAGGLTKAYDAKKFAGSVPAFATITLEEMKAWRDDR